MSAHPGTPRPMSEEARLQIAVVAGATERSNRPRFLLVLAALALAGASVYAFLQFRDLSDARATLRAVQVTEARVEQLREQLLAAQSRSKDDGLAPDPLTAQKLQQLATQVGLPSSVRLGTSQSSANAPGYVRRQYNANFRAPDIGPVLDWVQQATGPNSVGLSGVELRSILLRPLRTNQTGGWDVKVEFTRLERDR